MGRRRTQNRARALRQARHARENRDARLIGRSVEAEEALADYFQAIRRAEVVHDRAMDRAARVLAGAEREIGPLRQSGALALLRLSRLGETQTAIGELTGLSRSAVRDMLTDARSAAAEVSAADAADLDGPAGRHPDGGREHPEFEPANDPRAYSDGAGAGDAA